MSDYFTKQEAINLLGQKVEIKQNIYFESDKVTFIVIEKGKQGEVYLIENDPNGIVIHVLIDEDYQTFNKVEFNKYCHILNYELVNYASYL